jgi:hypothetical protein
MRGFSWAKACLLHGVVFGLSIAFFVGVLGCDDSPTGYTGPTLPEGDLVQDIGYTISLHERSDGVSLYYHVTVAELAELSERLPFQTSINGREVNGVTVMGNEAGSRTSILGTNYFHTFDNSLPGVDSVNCTVAFPEGYSYSSNLPTGRQLELVGISGYEVVVQDSIVLEAADWNGYTHIAVASGYPFDPLSMIVSDSTITVQMPTDLDSLQLTVIAIEFPYQLDPDDPEYWEGRYPQPTRSYQYENILISEWQDYSYSRELVLVKDQAE